MIHTLLLGVISSGGGSSGSLITGSASIVEGTSVTSDYVVGRTGSATLASVDSCAGTAETAREITAAVSCATSIEASGANSVRSLLLESGDTLLLETSDKLLLEAA